MVASKKIFLSLLIGIGSFSLSAFAADKSADVKGDTFLLNNQNPPIVWQGTDIFGMIAGGASAGYTRPSGHHSEFDILDLNPLLIFSYKDLLLMRAAIDFAMGDQGETDVNLDFMNLNLILNDYVTFGIGKFDSALGYFGQNLSPAWINRLPESPVGFDGDQAAPQIEIGAQLRGGFPLFCTARGNYVVYVSDGPRAFADLTSGDIDHIGTDGYTVNYGNFVYGGRLGFLPIPKLELGVSAAFGKAALIDMADNTTVLGRRVYHALGADASFKTDNWDFRAEYIQQQIASENNSVVPQGEKWKAWYLQAAYWIPTTNFEPVVRYGKFSTPFASQNHRQWAFGLDYWFASSIGAQAAFEFNKGLSGTDNNDNRFIIQLVFGY